MHYVLTPRDREQYYREGFLILKGIIPAEGVEGLKNDIRDLVESAASGRGPEIPWIDREKRLPERLSLLLRPGWSRPAFVDSLLHGPYFPVSEQILGKPARYSLFGMLAGGAGKSYIQAWHRDLAPVVGPDQMPVLERNYRLLVQTNAPLFADCYLAIVPGSHLRPVTEAESQVLQHSPTGPMPGGTLVEMQPGDVAFYYPNLIHRGYNPTGAIRWTMHHAFLDAATPVAAHEGGQESWIPEILPSLPRELGPYFQRYLDAVPDGEPPTMASA